jgi:hypothetical protein
VLFAREDDQTSSTGKTSAHQYINAQNTVFNSAIKQEINRHHNTNTTNSFTNNHDNPESKVLGFCNAAAKTFGIYQQNQFNFTAFCSRIFLELRTKKALYLVSHAAKVFTLQIE